MSHVRQPNLLAKKQDARCGHPDKISPFSIVKFGHNYKENEQHQDDRKKEKAPTRHWITLPSLVPVIVYGVLPQPACTAAHAKAALIPIFTYKKMPGSSRHAIIPALARSLPRPTG
ncbi:hypothetical protein [Brevibacillus massiliensis]|jgi:hypothetical protein|uniref:hypothetical protein n=1 Tax=Brevibacillus massiliensis TaxID=1118054 RepID=UPI00164D8F36|nr:hypothetical protein [Brevibacillus massiliensis]